jgi:3-dehydroquinate dehydratase II
MTSILLLNGPNLNLLGQREPHIYGAETLSDVEARTKAKAASLGFELSASQSNHEGELVTWIQQARNSFDAIILNAGAYTHTSVAIHDALRAFDGIVVELHISNPLNREPFRHRSFVAPTADVVIAGFGTAGYEVAVEAIAEKLSGTAA